MGEREPSPSAGREASGPAAAVLPESLGGYTVGVLVQSNFGGILQMNGAPVGIELGRYSFSEQVTRDEPPEPDDVQEGGSIIIVAATDAPLSDRNLERVARRAVMGLSRTGSYASNGSGDYVIAFSTSETVRRTNEPGVHTYDDLANTSVSALFQATIEATEEAIYNSLLKAETVTSNGRTVEALPIQETVEILERYGVVR